MVPGEGKNQERHNQERVMCHNLQEGDREACPGDGFTQVGRPMYRKEGDTRDWSNGKEQIPKMLGETQPSTVHYRTCLLQHRLWARPRQAQDRTQRI
jgi:hypothetical protein